MATLEQLQKALINADRAATAGDEGAANDARALAAEIKAMRSQKQSAPDGPGAGAAFMRGAGQGASFGTIDEGAGMIGGINSLARQSREPGGKIPVALPGTDAWKQGREKTQQMMQTATQEGAVSRDQYRANDRAAEAAHPGAFGTGEFAGAVVPAVAGIGVGLNAARGGGLLAKSVASGVAGGAEAGIYGFNQGEGGVQNRLQAGIEAAPWGAAFGVAMPAAGNLAAKTWRAASDRSSPAVKMISRMLARDGLDTQQLGQKVADLGPDAMPVDVSRSMREAGAGVARLPGAGQNIMKDAIEGRVSRAKGNMKDTVDALMGTRNNQFVVREAERKARNAAARTGYGEAFSANWGDAGPPFAMDDIMSRVKGSDLQEAMSMARDEGVDFGRTLLADIADDGSYVLKRKPSLAEGEYIRRAIADRADSSFRGGKGGAGSSASGLESELRDILDTASPRLKQTRSDYADAKAVERARELGRRIYTGNADMDELEAIIPRMGKAEQAALQDAARSNIADIMDTASWNAQDSVRRMRTDRNMDKSALVIGRETTDNLVKVLENERTKQLTNNRILSGSDTAANQAIQKELGDRATGIEGQPQTFFGAGVRAVDWLANARLKMKGEETRAAIAKALTGADPQILQQIAQYGPRMKVLDGKEKVYAEVARKLLSSQGKVAAQD
jgi:hypothetical protein